MKSTRREIAIINGVTHAKCSGCGQWLPLDQYHRDTARLYEPKIKSRCATCSKRGKGGRKPRPSFDKGRDQMTLGWHDLARLVRGRRVACSCCGGTTCVEPISGHVGVLRWRVSCLYCDALAVHAELNEQTGVARVLGDDDMRRLGPAATARRMFRTGGRSDDVDDERG